MSLYCHDRFKTWISATTGGDVLGEVVVAELYDAAQSELAALREELATANRGLANCKLALDAQTHNYNTSQQRLADADRRNAELLDLLRDIKDAPGGSSFRKHIEAALTKPEEAKS